MNSIRRLSLLALTLILGACASTFQPSHYADGISHEWLDSNRFVVEIRDRRGISEEKAVDLALLQSAEIALQNGFSYFVIIDGDAPAAEVDGLWQAGAEQATVQDGRRYRPTDPGFSNTVVCFETKPEGFAYLALFVKASLRARYGLDRVAPGV